MAMLEVSNLSINYGAIKAVKNISFEVNEGEIVTLIGSNGAGKSSTMNTLAGLIKASAGTVTFNGKNITNAKSDVIVCSGISLSPEGRQVFPRLSVQKNLELGAYTVGKEEMQSGLENAYKLFPILRERKKQHAGTLSGGEQQMLAVARALMSKPKMLMLDEPSLGLAPIIVEEIFSLIKKICREDGVTVLLVEQNARMALSISDRGYVFETGTIVLTDTGENLLNNERVLNAYLGGEL